MTEQERIKAIEFIVSQKRFVTEEAKKTCDVILEALTQPPALVVKSDMLLRPESVDKLVKDLKRQIEGGVVYLPAYLHATYVPRGLHIIYEWEAESEAAEQ